jgi:phage tail-like protein
MAVQREDPYGPFNFRVTITPGTGAEIKAAFSEVTGMTDEIVHADYRTGTDPFNHVRKVPLMNKPGDVTFKRGLIGAMDLFQWLTAAKNGMIAAKATVVIELLSEDRAATVATWQLANARPQKWTGPTLAAKGATDVAMEELVVVCEDITYS